MNVKTQFTLFLFISSFTTAFSQDYTENELMEFIKDRGAYVKLIDEASLPSAVMDYKNEIYKAIRKKKIKIDDALVLTSSIKTDSFILEIPMFDINGFIRDLKMNKSEEFKLKHHGQIIMTVGNASGKDGVIYIDTRKRRVIRYGLYQ